MSCQITGQRVGGVGVGLGLTDGLGSKQHTPITSLYITHCPPGILPCWVHSSGSDKHATFGGHVGLGEGVGEDEGRGVGVGAHGGYWLFCALASWMILLEKE